MLFDGIGRSFCHSGNLLYRIVFHIEKYDGYAFLGGKPVQSIVERLVVECGIGAFFGCNAFGLFVVYRDFFVAAAIETTNIII